MIKSTILVGITIRCSYKDFLLLECCAKLKGNVFIDPAKGDKLEHDLYLPEQTIFRKE